MIKAIFKIIGFIVILIGSFLLLLMVNHLIIGLLGNFLIHSKIENVEQHTSILVLGAGSTEPGKWVNQTFEYRMERTIELFNTGKSDLIVMSGKYQPPYYDEPEAMKKVLLDAGIPAENLVADYKGLRTWESVSSASTQFPNSHFTIIAQRAQLQRALVISFVQGLDANGLAAKDPKYRHWYWVIREVLARAKCSKDCFVFLIKKI